VDHAPYDRVPVAVLDAAVSRGLPVLEVPFNTPYVAVSEFVTTRLATEQLLAVQRAYDMQRQFTTAALEPRGRAEVVRLLAACTSTHVAVTTPRGDILDASPEGTSPPFTPLAADIERSRTQSTVVHVVDDDGSSVSIHPLGSRRRTRQLLVISATRSLSAFDRMVIAGAVTLLSIDAERHLGFSTERQVAAERLGALALRAGALARDRIDALATLGFSTAAPVSLASLRMPGSVGDAVAEGVNDILFERGVAHAFVTGVASEGTFTLIAETGPEELSEIVSEIFSTLGRRGGQAGISTSQRISDLLTGLRQAEAALRHAAQTRAGIQRFDDLSLHSVVLDAVPTLRLDAVADTILNALDSRDAEGQELLRTLEVFLRHNGHVGTASGETGVHRQTLVKRLSRIEELLDVSLDSPDDRGALWFALSARRLRR
jgi:purine catabolism regulator